MDELEAVGDPELRDALLFARGQARPVTADELADEQGVHRNVARSRLERLVEAGLLATAYERRTGRTGPGAGRPAKTYAVVPGLAPIEFPERRYEALLGLLVDGVSAKRLHAIGASFGEELARSAGLKASKMPQRAFEEMCRAVRSLGYQASLEEVDGTSAVVATPTCPLRPLVRAQPESGRDRPRHVGRPRRARARGRRGRARRVRDARLPARPCVLPRVDQAAQCRTTAV